MTFPSLEELAENWKLAHTIALLAWAVVAILGIILLLRNTSGVTYPTTERLKTYAAENATFKYPANWTINDCEPGKPFIELPGNVTSDYKDRDNYPLSVYGTGAYTCIKGRPERLDISREEIVASENPCTPATSTEGEKLSNGLYIQFKEQDDKLVAVYIKQNICFAPTDTVVLGFAFTDPSSQPGETMEFGLPTVDTEEFKKSPQYRDIRALAESIRY